MLPSEFTGHHPLSMPNGLMLKTAKAAGQGRAYAHISCAVWTGGVFLPVENNRDDVQRMRIDTSKIHKQRFKDKCIFCTDPGAVVYCFDKTCNYSYHTSCGQLHGCRIDRSPAGAIYSFCTLHVDTVYNHRKHYVKHEQGGGLRTACAQRRGDTNA